jgi:uncharacterized protein
MPLQPVPCARLRPQILSAHNPPMTFRGQIEDPPRSTTSGATLIMFLIVLFGLYQTHPFPDAIQVWVPRIILLMLPLSIASRSLYAIHLNIFIAGYYLINFFPRFSLYPFNHLGVLLLYAYIVMLTPSLRGSLGWFRLGKFDKTIWTLILITIIVPVIALITWVHFLSPDLSHYVGMVPHDPLWMLLLYAIANATFNAVLEEITWRGVMLEALDSAFGPGWCVLVIQSLSFAAAHYRNGFPNGIIGAAMVVVFGLMVGLIRRKSKGIVAGWLAHAAVDATIFCLILHFICGSS